jgi:type IV secretion system protein TrbL
MSKNEIKGLQQLAMAHGGSLTINPDTGLVEAGFLERALPLVAAAAATYFTAGAAAPALAGMLTGVGGMSAATAATAGGILAGAGSGALISGATAATQGQDVGKAAMMGGIGGAIAGGVGAYGDASTFAADATQKAALEGGTQAAGAGVTEGAVQGAGAAVTPPPTPTGLSFDPGAGYGTGVPTGGVPTPAQTSSFMQGDAGQLSGAQLGSSANTQLPAKSFYQGLEPNGIGRGLVQALPVAGLAEQGPTIGGQTTEDPMGYGLSADFQRYQPATPNPYYKAKYPNYQTNPYGAAEGGEIKEMAKGGLPADAPTMSNMKMFSDSDVNTRGLGALEAANYRNKKLMGKTGVKMAQMPQAGIKSLGGDFSDVGAAGGTAHLGDYSDGGRMLKGPGDGMSDSIPAQIGRKQPARLADGEFVVPADVVSHLGNGSTDAGAKQLYAMMDKIRSARTGKKKQAPAVKANKFMPA